MKPNKKYLKDHREQIVKEIEQLKLNEWLRSPRGIFPLYVGDGDGFTKTIAAYKEEIGVIIKDLEGQLSKI